MSDTRSLAKPKAKKPTPATRPSRRVILLSGLWSARIRSVFNLDATIFVSPDGAAVGDIRWVNVDTPMGAVPGATGMELVRGTVQGMHLSLEGYHAEWPIVCDQYSIRLCGSAEGGEFVGESVAKGWGGAKMSGTYHIVEHRE
jgi:hypothetical protein